MDALRSQLVEAGAQLSALGLSPGTTGNISVRAGDRILMSPTGTDLGSLDPAALSVLDIEGRLLDGGKPSKEFPLHRAFYRRDASTSAVVHLHSSHAAAVSCLPAWSAASAIPPLTPYFVMRVGQAPLIPYASPGDVAQAAYLEALGLPFSAALLQNHGSLTSGQSLAPAVDAAIELEEVSKLLLLLGERAVNLLPEGEAEHLAAKYGSAWTPTGPRPEGSR
jgi:ribulose-5-phosphate 4-epimerase/fuculose-1-phosphate aldolase